MVACNFILPTKFGLHDCFQTCNIENWKDKPRQFTKWDRKRYYNVITKCDRSFLQSASGITKCDRLLLQNASSKVINNLFDYSCLKIYVRKNIKTSTSNEIRKCGHNLQAFWDIC